MSERVAAVRAHAGRTLHVHHTPLSRTTGEPDHRQPKPMSVGRAVERLMVLGGVLADLDRTGDLLNAIRYDGILSARQRSDKQLIPETPHSSDGSIDGSQNKGEAEDVAGGVFRGTSVIEDVRARRTRVAVFVAAGSWARPGWLTAPPPVCHTAKQC